MDYNNSYPGGGGGTAGATTTASTASPASPTPSYHPLPQPGETPPSFLPSYVPTTRGMLPYAPLFSPQSPSPPSASTWQGVGESLMGAAQGESSGEGQTSPYAR